jgi:hypothetical protein
MSDSEDSDIEDFPFDRVEPTIPICLGIDPTFCKLAFDIKHLLYSDIMYQDNADTQEAQNIDRNAQYETIIDKLHTVLMNAFRTKGQANTGVPEPVQKILPANVKDKITELYNKCYEQANNDDRDQMEQHKLLINNLYHVYIYDMGSQNEESNKNKKPLIQ